MPGLNWMPGVSQLKSVCQLITGDVKGACQTQDDFLNECPGVSHSIALARISAGDIEGGKEMCRRSNSTISNVANGIPVVGHVKSAVHLICGDDDGARQAFQSATRSTVVMSAGVVAGVVSGGAAIPLAIGAGMWYDTALTIASREPKGLCVALDQVVKNPNAGNIFDATAIVVSDGLAGHSAAKLGQQVATKMKINNEINNLKVTRDAKLSDYNIKAQAIVDAQIELGNLLDARYAKQELMDGGGLNSGARFELGNEINAITKKIESITGELVEVPVLDGTKTVEVPVLGGTKTVKVPVLDGTKTVEVPGSIELLKGEVNKLAAEAKTINQTITSMRIRGGELAQTVKSQASCLIAQQNRTTTTSTTDSVSSESESCVSTTPEDEIIVGDEQARQTDLYSDYVELPLNQQKREAKSKKHYEQPAEENSIKNSDKTNWPDQTWKDLAAKSCEGDKENNPNPEKPQFTKKEEQYLTRLTYEEVQFPQHIFSYTGVILANRDRQGLLHTFARHHDQWVQFIPEIDSLMDQLPGSVRVALNAIQQVPHAQASDKTSMDKLYENLENAIKTSGQETEIRAIFLRIQYKILGYLRGAVKRTYIGDYVYERPSRNRHPYSDTSVRHLFRVEQLNGERYVISVGVSYQLDAQPDRLSGRPFRSIITVFFEKESEVRDSSNFEEYKEEKR